MAGGRMESGLIDFEASIRDSEIASDDVISRDS